MKNITKMRRVVGKEERQGIKRVMKYKGNKREGATYLPDCLDIDLTIHANKIQMQHEINPSPKAYKLVQALNNISRLDLEIP